MKIGIFTKQDNSYIGMVQTLTLKAKITIKPIEKNGETGPDFRVYVGNLEIGAAWSRTSRKAKRNYLSVKLDDPSFASAVFANLVEQDDKFSLIWNR